MFNIADEIWRFRITVGFVSNVLEFAIIYRGYSRITRRGHSVWIVDEMIADRDEPFETRKLPETHVICFWDFVDTFEQKTTIKI